MANPYQYGRNPYIDKIIMGQNPSVGDFIQPFGNSPFTPGINPAAPDHRAMIPQGTQPQKPQGVFGKLDQFMGTPGGGFLMNLLAQSGYSTMPQSPFGAIGKAALMTQQQQAGKQRSALEEELMRAQIGLANYKQSGMSGEDGLIGKLSPTMYTPESVQEFKNTGDYSKLKFRPELRLYTRPDGSIGIEDVGSSAIGDGSSVTRPDVVTPDAALSGAAERERTTKEAQGDPERQRKTPITLVKQKQIRGAVQDTIDDIKSGRLKTGIIQGKFSRFTTAGERLQGLSGRQVIDLISEATFGQLSEGERKFLRDITFSLDRTEGFNLEELEKFQEIIDKVISIEESDAGRLGVGSSSADDVAAKYPD